MTMMTMIKDSGRMIAGWAHSSSAAAVKSLIFLSSSPPCVMCYFVFCIPLSVFCDVLFCNLYSTLCILHTRFYVCFLLCMARICTFCIVKRTFGSTTSFAFTQEVGEHLNSALWDKPEVFANILLSRKYCHRHWQIFQQIFCVQENAAENWTLVKGVDKIVGTQIMMSLLKGIRQTLQKNICSFLPSLDGF